MLDVRSQTQSNYRRVSRVSTGRYRGLYRNQSVCNLCNDNHLVDVYYSLFECQCATMNDRKKYLLNF